MLAPLWTTQATSAFLRFQGAFGGRPRTVRSSELSHASLQTPWTWAIYRELEALPPFNPDLDGDDAPAAVARFRAALQACDAVLISSPEYAHGVPGVLKNALDWVVGSGELVSKPIALVNASGRAKHAWASLAETLVMMSALVIRDASITVSLEGRRLDADGIVGDAQCSRALRSAIEALAGAAREARRL